MPHHINPETGVVGACRAKKNCPFGGENNHFPTAELARETYEREMSLLETIGTGKPRQSAATDHALASTMKFKGREPKWLKKMKEKDRLMKTIFGVEPEIIDTIDSPIGELYVVYTPLSTRANYMHSIIEDGYAISSITYHTKSGDLAARIAYTYATDETIEQSFGNDEWAPYRYIAARKNFYGVERIYRDHDISDGEKLASYDPRHWTTYKMPDLSNRNEKFEFMHELSRKYDRWGNLNIKDFTDEQIDEKIAGYRKFAIEDFEAWKNDLTQAAYVEYINIDHPKLRGEGFGASLYIYAAKQLAKKGLALEESGVQTSLAGKAWRRMASDTRIPIKVAKRTWHHREYGKMVTQVATHYRIDYTDQREVAAAA